MSGDEAMRKGLGMRLSGDEAMRKGLGTRP